MHRRVFLHRSGLALVAAATGFPTRAAEGPTSQDIGELLEAARKEQKLPGLAAAAVRGDRIVAAGVAGVRQVGKPDKVELDDRFQLGSCTKAMTTLLICRLVDAGKLEFGTTLGDALPDVKMRDDYRPVTIGQLLTFQGGIRPYTRIGPKMTPILFEAGPVAERRKRFVEHLLQEEPVAKPGTDKKYSNASYVLAGFVASRKTGTQYEELVAQYVFKPLAMSSAGFAATGTKERRNEPAYHVKAAGGYEVLPEGERPAEQILAPAGGGCRCSIRDFARFAIHQLAAARGKDPLLKPATAERAREALRREGPGGGENHGGTPWLHAAMNLAPKKDVAVVVATNCGSGDQACSAVIRTVRDSLGLEVAE